MGLLLSNVMAAESVVTNVEASMCVETMAEKYGGKVVRTRVGDIYVSEAIERHGAVFGGEPCGAWVHPQQHLCPDGPLSAVLFLAALEEEGKSVSEFIGEVPEYITMRENIACKNEQKYKLVEQLGSALKVSIPSIYRFLYGRRRTLSPQKRLASRPGIRNRTPHPLNSRRRIRCKRQKI